MGNGYLADETRYLDPVKGEKGRKALHGAGTAVELHVRDVEEEVHLRIHIV